jgi:hypothetical protein
VMLNINILSSRAKLSVFSETEGTCRINVDTNYRDINVEFLKPLKCPQRLLDPCSYYYILSFY